jgi:hypothetical protein
VNSSAQPHCLYRIRQRQLHTAIRLLCIFELYVAPITSVGVCLQVEDVPSVWNQKMKDYLGTAPEDDAKGCLQVRSDGNARVQGTICMLEIFMCTCQELLPVVTATPTHAPERVT